MTLISDRDQKLVDFVRSKINLPDWSLGMAMRGFLEDEKYKSNLELMDKIELLQNRFDLAMNGLHFWKAMHLDSCKRIIELEDSKLERR